MPEQTYLNWPFLEDSHRTLAVEFRSWADREIAPLAEEEPSDEAGLDALARELVRRLADGGWLRYSVPAPWGGISETLDVRALCLMRETLAQYSGMADFSFVMQGLGTGPISLFGSEEIRGKYLPDVAAGKRIAAFALSEPESGSDVAAMTTNARFDGDAYILNGEKTLISNGGLAHQYVVFCRTEDAPGAKGLSALVVDADTPRPRLYGTVRRHCAPPAGADPVRGLPRARLSPARQSGRRLQDRHVVPGRLPVNRRRGGARFRPARP